jgi:hypothetical protein
MLEKLGNLLDRAQNSLEACALVSIAFVAFGGAPVDYIAFVFYAVALVVINRKIEAIRFMAELDLKERHPEL